MSHPAALIPGRAARADLQALLDATEVRTDGGTVILPDGSTKLKPLDPPAAPADGGFLVTRSITAGRVEIAPGWVHFHESWIQPATSLLIPNRDSATGRIRLVIEARATSNQALAFNYPVDVTIEGTLGRFEFYTGPGLPATNATGSTEGLKWEWYFYIATLTAGVITQNLNSIGSTPRPY